MGPLPKYSLILVVLTALCAADLGTKLWARENLKGKPPVTVISNFLDLGFAENRGMVFGFRNGKMPEILQNLLNLLRLLIVLGLTIFIGLKRKRPSWFLFPFLLFWAGGAGNLIDSVLNGYVTDFIHIRAGSVVHWPFFFNVADIYVTVGIALIFAYELARLVRRA